MTPALVALLLTWEIPSEFPAATVCPSLAQEVKRWVGNLYHSLSPLPFKEIKNLRNV